MNASKSWFKRIRTFLRNRLLPHPVPIALFGNKDSGKTTLLRSINDGKVGYPLDDDAANRMDVGVSDQDVIDILYRVFGRHGFRDFVVKDYKGVHFSATQFRARVLDGAEGIVILVRASRFVEDTKDARDLKRRYLEFCKSLRGVRAAVLLEVAPDEVKEPKNRKLADGLLNEFQKTIEDAGIAGKAIRRFSFQKPATEKQSLKEKRETANRAAAPFLWLSEQLDKSLWTWIRTRWWTWMILVPVVVVLTAASLASAVRGCGRPPPPDTPLQNDISEWKGVLKASVPNTETWSEWEEHRTAITNLLAWARFTDACATDGQFAEFVDGHKNENDGLAVKLFEKDTADNIDWMSLVGTNDNDIVSFGKKLASWTSLSPETEKEIDELRNRWKEATKQIDSQPSPSAVIDITYRLLKASRASSRHIEEAKKKRQDALETVLNQILGWFNEKDEPEMSENGLPRNAERLERSLFPKELESWKKTIASRRGELVRKQIEEWKKSAELKSNPKDKSPDAGRLLRKYAPFARSRSENPDFQQATDYVAEVVGPKLIELARTLENALKENNPSEKTLQAGARTLKELRDLCSSIRNDMVQKTPFRDRWESRYANDFMSKASIRDKKGGEHPREFLEMFRWKVSIETVKLRLVNSADEYWVALENDPGLKWDSDQKKRVKDKTASSTWIIPRPAEFAKMKNVDTGNVGPSRILDRPGGDAGIMKGGPFDSPSLILHVCQKGEKRKRLEEQAASIPVCGAKPFFTDKDDKDNLCRRIVFVLDKTKKSEVQCWLYGTESAIRPLQMLEEAKNAGTTSCPRLLTR